MAGVNFVLAAIAENLFPQGVVADQAGAEERKDGAGSGQINQHVVGRAAGPLRLAADVAQLLRLRINVYEFDLVNDPVAPGQQSATVVCAFVLHGAQGPV